MRSSAGFIFLPLIALAGCGEARGSAPDASNDVHCSVLTFYFNGFTEYAGAPADQRRAMAVVNEWYAAKVRQRTAERGESDSIMAEGAAILEVVKRDPDAMLDELRGCTDRALADPAFNGFVSATR